MVEERRGEKARAGDTRTLKGRRWVCGSFRVCVVQARKITVGPDGWRDSFGHGGTVKNRPAPAVALASCHVPSSFHLDHRIRPFTLGQSSLCTMYPLQAIHNCTERKRRREDVDSPDVPPAKRHHQRHLTSTPSKRKVRLSTKLALSTQRRYSLRATAERARRNVTQNLAHIPVTPAPLPLPTPVPVPILPTTRIPSKRPRNAVEADICEEPPAKRHHQRHLTSPPPKRKTRTSTRAAVPPQSRYSLRTTADRVRRNTTATLAHNPTVVPPIPAPTPAHAPIVSPPPVLVKRRRLTDDDDFDVDVPEEPHAKRYRLSPSPSKPTSDSSTKPAIAIQSRYFLRMTSDRIRRIISATPPHIPSASPRIPVQPPPRGSMPTPEFFTTPASTVVDTPVPPSACRASDHDQAHRIPIQSSNTAATPLPHHPLAGIPTRPPVDLSVTSTTFKRTHVPWDQLPERERTRLFTVWAALISRLWKTRVIFTHLGFDTYARALGLSSCHGPDDLTTLAVLRKYPDLEGICADFRNKFIHFHELCNHRECSYSILLILALTGESQVPSMTTSTPLLTRS